MKQINGTITLSFLEEDNQQRVIFRVVPLCTREGAIFREKSTDFPDQGSLRIVPDKREQSTFKERMRSMGNLCAIQLCSDGKELAKVRQNRNYDPGQGESNQFAIYSDVICEFAEDGVFEVFNDDADFSRALSPRVLLRRGKVLYGPLERDAMADWSALRPFGNDSYLLHTAELNDGGEHSFYWNPEQTVSWRQRRGTLRRGKQQPEDGVENAMDTDEQSMPVVAQKAEPVKTVSSKLPERSVMEKPTSADPAEATRLTQANKPINRTPVEPIAPERPQQPFRTEKPLIQVESLRRVERVERRREQEEGASLPIGKRLTILDDSITFDEQISKLDQPLSVAANLLTHASSQAVGDEPASTVRFNGTPLTRAGVKTPQPIRHGEPLHYVVERQIRSAHCDQGERGSDYQHVENPIENLHVALEKAWQTPETRQQAMQSLCENEAFMQLFLKHLHGQGQELKAIEAAQEQLEDIEAERLSLLMQLENTKTDYKRAMETMHAELSQKKREELNQLDRQLLVLKDDQERITNIIATLGDQAQQRTLEWLESKDFRLCASNGETIALSPTVGVKRSPAEMIASIRTAMNRQGFACNEDDATELLLHFALNDEFCLCGDTLSEAELCARTLLEGLGLMDVAARTHENTRLEVASFLPNNGQRSPTVEVCPLGRPALNPYGHKTIRLTEARALAQMVLPLPVVYTPAFRPQMRDARVAEPIRPASLESFGALRTEGKPLLEHGEAWFSDLEKRLAEQSSLLSGVGTQQMRLFVSAAACKLRGGFLAAADAAVLGWVIPEVFKRELNPEPLRQEIGNLPRCLAALGIR